MIAPPSILFVPARPATEFLATLPELGSAREALVLQEFLSGNIPAFMCNWVEVPVAPNASIFVMPDYLCLGTGDDFCYIPLWPTTAQTVANAYGAMLPTRKMVNDIWKAGTVKLAPQPWGAPWDVDMERTHRWATHTARINAKRWERYPDSEYGDLVVGHKKDIVISATMNQHPKNVYIYGWHQLTGQPIQGINGVSHSNTYSDYSHGVRLVSQTMVIDGKEISVADVLKDPKRCSLVSDEGVVKKPLY